MQCDDQWCFPLLETPRRATTSLQCARLTAPRVWRRGCPVRGAKAANAWRSDGFSSIPSKNVRPCRTCMRSPMCIVREQSAWMACRATTAARALRAQERRNSCCGGHRPQLCHLNEAHARAQRPRGDAQRARHTVLRMVQAVRGGYSTYFPQPIGLPGTMGPPIHNPGTRPTPSEPLGPTPNVDQHRARGRLCCDGIGLGLGRYLSPLV